MTCPQRRSKRVPTSAEKFSGLRDSSRGPSPPSGSRSSRTHQRSPATAPFTVPTRSLYSGFFCSPCTLTRTPGRSDPGGKRSLEDSRARENPCSEARAGDDSAQPGRRAGGAPPWKRADKAPSDDDFAQPGGRTEEAPPWKRADRQWAKALIPKVYETCPVVGWGFVP